MASLLTCPAGSKSPKLALTESAEVGERLLRELEGEEGKTPSITPCLEDMSCRQNDLKTCLVDNVGDMIRVMIGYMVIGVIVDRVNGEAKNGWKRMKNCPIFEIFRLEH